MERSEQFWDKLSKNYDRKAKDKTFERILFKSRKYFYPEAVVLDFACATGLYSLEFADSVKKIYGFDTSSKMIAIAKKLAKETEVENVIFSQTDIFDEKFEEGSFDIILAFNILLYFEDAQEVLQRMHRLLKPNGFIISSTACLGEKRTFIGFVSGLALSLLKKFRVLPYLKFLRLKELEDAISSNGFRIIESDILIEKPAVESFIVAEKVNKSIISFAIIFDGLSFSFKYSNYTVKKRQIHNIKRNPNTKNIGV